MPDLLAVGLSHRSAPVEVRERLAIGSAEVPAAVQAIAALPAITEAVVLSTCNRVEVYVAASEPVLAAAALREHLARRAELAPEQLDGHLYEHVGAAAVRHILRVASSLDSMVVGEPQILGQVKDAFALAVGAGSVGPLLGRCLEHSFAVAKRVRTETAIARGAANVSSVAVTLAQSLFASLAGRTVLLVGAGTMATLAARHLVADGAERVVVVNRSLERAEVLAATIAGEVRPFEQLEAALATADIAITSTGANEPIVGAALMKRVMRARRGRPIFLIDIAVPRDVDKAVGALDGVYLYDVDDLESVVRQTMAEREAEAEAAERIVEHETGEFLVWLERRALAPTIGELREQFMAIAQAHAERAITSLAARQQPLADAQAAAVREMAESIARRLLRGPVQALCQRGEATHDLAAAARRLFGLSGAKDGPAGEG